MRFYKLTTDKKKSFFINPSSICSICDLERPVSIYKDGISHEQAMNILTNRWRSISMDPSNRYKYRSFEDFVDRVVPEMIEKKINAYSIGTINPNSIINDQAFIEDTEFKKMMADLGYPEEFI